MIQIDIAKAKDIAHTKRRVLREQELQPLDIKATIPMYAEQAELERQLLRDKYATIQGEIDRAECVADLKKIIALIL